MDAQQTLSHSSDVAFSKVEDEYILMSLERGAFYILDGPAAEIWGKLESAPRFGELVDGLVEDFDVDRSTCEQDCKELLIDLIEKKLVIVG